MASLPPQLQPQQQQQLGAQAALAQPRPGQPMMMGQQPQLHQQPQQQLNLPQGFTREKVAQLFHRINLLRSQGATPENSPELQNLMGHAHKIQQWQQQAVRASSSDPHAVPNGQPMLNGAAPQTPTAMVMPNGPTGGGIQPPPAPSTPISFTPEQLDVIRSQVTAYKYVSRGMALPEQLQQAIHLPGAAVHALDASITPTTVDGRVVDAAVKVHKGGDTPTNGVGPTIKEEQDLRLTPGVLEDSPIYPYNAYIHPFTHLKRPADADPSVFAARLQRLLVPTLMPQGLDPHQILAERNRFIEARIQQRIAELEALPATMGENGAGPDAPVSDKDDVAAVGLGALVAPAPPTTPAKLRALIELKALRVLDRQRELRAMVAERLTHGALLPLGRADFRRVRKPDPKSARATETAERKQRVERERRAKQKHVAQLNVICVHGREVLAANRAAQDRMLKLGRAVMALHAHTEKEEQKRIERISKERLKALKADDEEAYMKLIDTAKDTRITHLLKQTDSYLDSLAAAVVAQQNENGAFQDYVPPEDDDGPTNEATFGASVSADPEDANDAKKVDYYAVAHRIKEKVTKQPSILIGGTLKEYQLKGLQWMVSLYNNKLDGILADEMGLGKTIQTISLITFLIEVKRQRGPYLVIVPLSTMTNWSGEFAKWAPSVRMIAYKGNPAQRRTLQNEIRAGQFQVLLTTYEYIIKDRPILSKMRWVHMIIDEGHRMKNTQSKLSQTLSQYYHTRHRLILTGTPLQNNLPELWALLNFVLPRIFNSVKSFDEWFNTPFANTGDKIELNEEEALLIIRRLHKVLRPFLLRRLKKDVESELPDKVEKVIKVRMSGLQSQLYKQIKKYKMIADGKDDPSKPGGGVKGLSNELMQLRKICQHPFLFESVEDRLNPTGMIDDKIIRSAGKIELLARILPKFFATDHRVLIFFQMTRVMDIMEDFLKMMGWKYLRLDGGTKTEDRAGHVQLFNAPNSEYKVFILSTRAGGLGLNLQTADTVIIYDSDWNPHADLQAQDRAHRIGQTKVVRILRFITEKSVEEAMYARARYKLDIDDKVIQAGRFDNKSTVEEREEFLRSILEADQEEENEEAGDMNDEEINELISRSEEESALFRDMDIAREREAAENWKAAGNRGKPPPPLMQVEELPECYKTDSYFENREEDEGPEGRGARRRNVVSYSDGLSDEQWAIAIEEGEDIEELAERTRANRNISVNYGEEDEPEPSRPRKGRKPKNKQPAEVSFDILSNKRKRGPAKQMSVSPSVQEEEDEDRGSKRRKTDVSTAVREKMKKAFMECHKAVMACEAEDGRKRCDLFKEIPDKRLYPDYYQLIRQPIALSTLRKRAMSNHYKDVQQYRADFKLMFSNAKTYNQEGSWVYVDAEEMERVFDATFNRVMVGSGLPGAPTSPIGGGSGSATAASARSPADDDDFPVVPRRREPRVQMISEDEYFTPSDDDDE